MSKSNYKFIISGGGTGGHIFPAIAVANELKKQFVNCEILFIGAKGRMEMKSVPEAGFPIEGLWISGLQRKLTLKNLSFPFKVISSLIKARRIVKKYKPDFVIGTGGYASGPTLKAAQALKIPTLIQEQNSFPGITNKLLAPKVYKICVAYDNMTKFFPEEKLIKTGNPIRNNIVDIKDKRTEGLTFFDLENSKKTVLLIGGSQGALSINKAIKNNINIFKELNLQFVWQTGVFYYEEALKIAEGLGNIKVHKFIKEMDLAYAASDIVISRAGAIAISELCAVSRPVIFIPLPSAAEDHQTKNAKALVEVDAAIMIKDKSADNDLSSTLSDLVKDESRMQVLSLNIKKLAVLNAAERIVNEIKINLES